MKINIADHYNLVHSIIKNYAGKRIDYDDLFQEGVIGLIQAAERYDPSIGAFSTYATFWIKQNVLRAFKNRSFIKIPEYASGLGNQLNNSEDEIDKVDRNWDKRKKDIANRAAQVLSSPVFSIFDKDGAMISIQDTKTQLSPEDKMELEKAINSLSERDRQIIQMRFFERMTLADTAKVLGISRERVNQIAKSAINRLRVLIVKE